jgi:hypothetical protein
LAERLRFVGSRLEPSLTLRKTGRRNRPSFQLREGHPQVTAPTLWVVLLIAAADVTSIHADCAPLDGLASEETIRQALYACLPEFAELQRRLNEALAGRLPRALRRRRQRLAIDLTLIPSHGEPFRDPAEVYRSRGWSSAS